MTGLGLLIVGVILVIVAYFLPATTPPPLKTILNVIGYCCLIVGLILVILALFGVVTGPSFALR